MITHYFLVNNIPVANSINLNIFSVALPLVFAIYFLIIIGSSSGSYRVDTMQLRNIAYRFQNLYIFVDFTIDFTSILLAFSLINGHKMINDKFKFILGAVFVFTIFIILGTTFICWLNHIYIFIETQFYEIYFPQCSLSDFRFQDFKRLQY